ncbi:MAG: hypothetical protein L3J25_07430 [Flavobacteriaceae bacterium]|nr:hypothetical protein [Flavobacteriaceae bacterium]
MKKLVFLFFGIVIGVGVSYFYFNEQEVTLEEEIVKPKGLITPDEAKALDQAFNSRHALISDSIVKKPDNRSSWYSLEDMKNYLKYAENQSRELGYTMDGVRVYLGAHADVKEEVGYTTMFLVPTGTKSISQGSMLNVSLQGGGGDISGGPGLNGGKDGEPPNANYPQQ